ncbi:MAG TPA: cytochrome c [Vicinamibacterales bacterium]|nr:cytochrome c [Vicinamibacterales bacterium]
MKRPLYLTAGCGLLAAAVLRAAPVTVIEVVAPAQKIDAAALYSQYCEMCHGPKGVATAPEMSFKGRAWKHGTSAAAMAKVIRDGVEATGMIAFSQKLSAAEISALARLVRSFDSTLKPERAGGS